MLGVQKYPRRKNDRVWTAGFAVVVLAATSLPYLIGYLSQGDAWKFTGFVFGVDDGNSYVAKMLSGASGAWLFRTPYTAYPQDGVLAFLPYLLLGKIPAFGPRHVHLVFLFHVFRVVAGFLAILATRDFIDLFLKERTVRRWGLVLATIGGGLGWFLLLSGRDQWLGSLPLDFFSPETFGFLSIYGLPHLALARALMLWGLIWLVADFVQDSAKVDGNSATPVQPGRFKGGARFPGLKAGIFWIGLGIAQPLTLVVAYVVAWCFFLAWSARRAIHRGLRRWRLDRPLSIFLQRLITASVLSAPVVFYTAWRFQSDPFLRIWTEQNRILSPHPLHYLLAYGAMLPLLALGVRQVFRRNSPLAWLPVIWTILLPVLAYAPYNLQRRLPEGIWVAIVVVALMGLESSSISRRLQGAILRLLPIALLPSTVLLLVGGIQTALRPDIPVFRSKAEVQAFEFIGQEARVGDVVVTAFSTGNALPAWAPVRVVIGHGPESANLAVLQDEVEAFFRDELFPGDRQAWLKSLDVSWIIWGPAERTLGEWSPGEAGYLERVFSQGDYEIFKVTP